VEASNGTANNGAETVVRLLDVLNNRFQTLLAILLDRLKQLAAMLNDPELQVRSNEILFT